PNRDVEQWRSNFTLDLFDAIAVWFYAAHIRDQFPTSKSYDDRLLVVRPSRKVTVVEDGGGVFSACQEAVDEIDRRLVDDARSFRRYRLDSRYRRALWRRLHCHQ